VLFVLLCCCVAFSRILVVFLTCSSVFVFYIVLGSECHLRGSGSLTEEQVKEEYDEYNGRHLWRLFGGVCVLCELMCEI